MLLLLARWWNKLRSALGRGGGGGGVEGGLAEEIRLHREMLEERFRGEGLTEREARERAGREFGPELAALESSRAEWSFAWLESVWLDLRQGARSLSRSRSFTITAVLTLGAGLGLASVAFTLFNAYVLRPFAVTDPASLYEVAWVGRERDAVLHPLPEIAAIRARRDVFTDVLAVRSVFVSSARRAWPGALVSGNYFRTLGARIAMGRPIEEDDLRIPGRDRIAVLSHAAWRAAFGGDAAVLGKTLRLRGELLEIVGVAAPEFGGLDASGPDFWAPLSLHSLFWPGEPALAHAIGRIRADVTTPRAEAALAAMARQSLPANSADRASLRSRSSPIEFSPMLLVVFAPVLLALGLVLATCCANGANLMLARALARQRELGVRLAIGAGRVRLVRQLVTEALMIAALAGALGLLLSGLLLESGLRLFLASVPGEFAAVVRLGDLRPDYRVYLFALTLAALAAVGAALLPALQSTRIDLTSALRGEFGAAAAGGAGRLRSALVVVQVVVCVVLLACGALVYRRATVFQSIDPGITAQGVVDLNLNKLQDRVAAGLAADRPDLVEMAAAARRVPWYGRLDRTLVRPEGPSSNMAPVASGFNVVSPEYFAIFGIPITRGRPFTPDEARDGAPVAIVSEATARAFWPNQDPLGKTIRTAPATDHHLENLEGFTSLRVIGVARDVVTGWIFDGKDSTCLYLPAAVGSPRARQTLVKLRSGGKKDGASPAALDQLRRYLDDRWPAVDASPVSMSAVLALQLYPFRAAAWIAWMLGLVALGLAVSGVYAVLSYLVSQRAKEIGIRVALGATPGQVARLVLGQCAMLSGAGVLVGSAVAAGAVQLLLWWSASVRFLEWDGPAIAGGAFLAVLASLMAAAGPARRAARVDPNEVLRAG